MASHWTEGAATRTYRMSFNQALHVVSSMLQGSPERASIPTLRYSLCLDGDVNIAAVRRSLAALIRRHESLRTAFPDPCRWSDDLEDAVLGAVVHHDICGGGKLRQRVWHPGFSELMALRAITIVAGGWTEKLREALSRPFDLSQPPLMRVLIRKRRSGSYQLVAVLHHLIGDGFSFHVMRQDLEALYARQLGERDRSIQGALPVQYGDFAESQWARFGQHLDSEVMTGWERAKKYAFDPRSLGRRVGGRVNLAKGRRELTLSPRLVRGLIDVLIPHSKGTLYMILVTAIAAAIAGRASTDKIGFLAMCANRTSSDMAKLIGWFTNLGVLCVDVDRTESLSSLLGRVKRLVFEALRTQEVPLQALWQCRYLENLFCLGNFITCDVVTHGEPSSVCGMRVASTPLLSTDPPTRVPFSLRLHQWRAEGATTKLVLECGYYPGYNDPATIDRLLRSIQRAFELMCDDPHQPVSAVTGTTQVR